MAASVTTPSLPELVPDDAVCFDIPPDILNEQLTGVSIDYDDDAILAFNPALRDDIGRYPVANYAPSDIDLQSNHESIQTDEETQNSQNCVPKLILSEDSISSTEYDDDAILDFNPKIKNDIGRNQQVKYADDENQMINKDVMASGDMAFGREKEVERLTREMVENIQSKIPHLQTFRQELSQMQEDVNNLKEEYSGLDNSFRKTSIAQNRTVQAARAYIHNLDLVIYQNRVIHHLDDAEKHMKLFDCHVTADRKIIFVDPEKLGTDIDTPVQMSTSRALTLVDTEFKRGFATGKADDAWGMS